MQPVYRIKYHSVDYNVPDVYWSPDGTVSKEPGGLIQRLVASHKSHVIPPMSGKGLLYFT